MKDIGEKIKAIRESKKITLKTMGDLFGIGLTTYSARESKGDFSETDLMKILRKLGVSKEYFDGYFPPGKRLELSLPESVLNVEAKIDVVLQVLGELLAKQNGQSVTGTMNDLTKAVKEGYDRRISELLK